MSNKRVSRREFLRLAGGAAGVSFLAACAPAAVPGAAPGAGSESGGEAAAPAQDPGTLWVFHKQDFHDGYNEFIRNHIVQFAEEKGLTLDVAFTSGFAGTGADEQKIAAAVQAGDPPDVWVDNRSVNRLHQLGTLQPVTDLVEEVVSRYGEPTERTKRDTTIEGEYYGVPFHVRSDGGWARADVFEAAGIDIASIRTFDALREAAMEVSDAASEMWGWGLTINRGGDGNYFFNRVLHGFGATWTDETGQYVTVNSPEAIDAVNWLVDTYTNPDWEPMLPPGVMSWTDTSNNEAYVAGRIAYTQNAGTVYATMVQNANPLAEATIYHPPVGGPVLQEFNGLGGMYHMLIQGAKNPDVARELILTFFTDEVLQGVYESAVAYAVPAFEPMWEWEIIANNPISVAQQPAAMDPSGWNGLAWPGPATPQIASVETANIQTDMVANVINGQMTVEEAVQDAYEKSVQIFQEFGAPGEQ